MRLLVVEDEKSIAEAIQALLADKGYSVDLVFDGDDGLEYILT
ncbi:TPA: DNA-binding response regulator, partial [Streptococcus pyogenes]|nr:DNA-binding response regulator [Streptococcus pyogenes]